MKRDAFSTYHPAVTLAFFVGAIALCVMVQQPLFQAAGLLGAALLCLATRGARAGRLIAGMLVVFAVLTLVNPLFNTQGQTVLLTLLGRPYTLEALAYGASTAAMFVTMLLWFLSFGRIITSDKVTYLFGAVAPAATMALTMVMRLVPAYRRRGRRIAQGRQSIGKGPAEGGLRQRLGEGSAELGALGAWALEGSLVTADSMAARGYGLGRRTSYARYRFIARDGVLAAFLALTFLLACLSLAMGGAAVAYVPVIDIPPLGPWGWAGLGAFLAFVLAPSLVDAGEAALWRFSVSKA